MRPLKAKEYVLAGIFALLAAFPLGADATGSVFDDAVRAVFLGSF